MTYGDAWVQSAVHNKKRKAPPLTPTFTTPTVEAERVKKIVASPTGPEIQTENSQGTMFRADKVSPIVAADPALTRERVVPGVPVAETQPLSPYDQAYKKYDAEMKRGPQKQGVASQVLFQVAEAMANFGRLYHGQQMKPHQWLGEAKDARRDARAAQEFAPYEAERQRQAALQLERQKQTAATAEAQAKMLEAARAQNPYLGQQIEQMIKNGQPIPKDLADQLKGTAYGTVIPGIDARPVEYQESDGEVKSRRKGAAPGEGWTTEPGLGDKTKRPIERKLATGETFYTTGDKEADRERQRSLDQARLDMEAGRASQQDLARYQTDMEQWSKETQENTQKRSGYLADANTAAAKAQARRDQAHSKRLRAQEIGDDDPEASRKLKDEADALDVEARGMEEESQGLRRKADSIKNRPAPKFSGRTQAPKVTSGTQQSRTVTQSQLSALSKRTGKSVEELRKMAEAEGYTVK